MYQTAYLTDVTDEAVLGDLWPGIELYYPPVKYSPAQGVYEDLEAASERMKKHAHNTNAHTLLFDLEDGCRQKELSRELLRKELPVFPRDDVQIAARINPFRTEEYEKDLAMVRDIAEHIDVIYLAKAGESYGRDLSSWLTGVNGKITIQPIIEHPKSLKLAPDLMAFPSVKHVVFGIHDFSKAMAIHITPKGWIDELDTYLKMLLFEARIQGKGVIGGVEVLINEQPMPEDFLEEDDVRRWLGDEESHTVYSHACEEAALGLTGKQVIHPNHIHLCRVAFTPSPNKIKRNIEILKAAVEADALMGGAIKFEGEMLDPPMFGKALLRARALNALSPEDTGCALEILKKLPVRVIRENWPYGTVL